MQPILTEICCSWGQPYIEHGFLYHLSRKDHRHNFSAYFLPTYLGTVPTSMGELGLTSDHLSFVLPDGVLNLLQSPLVSFVPQLLLVATLGFSLGTKDVVAAMFAQTMAFVHWNKVITSQYFLWYLWLLPVLLPNLDFGNITSAWATLAVWVGSQALWLSQAYLLENLAQHNYVRVWLAGLSFLAAQSWVLVAVIAAWGRARLSYIRQATTSNGKAKD